MGQFGEESITKKHNMASYFQSIFICADVYNDLRAFPYTEKTLAFCFGRLTDSDGGQALWWYSETSTAVDDGLTVLKPNAIVHPNPGRWLKVVGQFNSLTDKPTISFAQASATRAIVTGSNPAGFQLSATKDAFVFYSVRATPALSLTSGQNSLVKLQISANGTSGWQDVTNQEGGISGTLVVGLGITNANGGMIGGFVPKGWYARLLGTGVAATFQSGQEILIN